MALGFRFKVPGLPGRSHALALSGWVTQHHVPGKMLVGWEHEAVH